MAYYNVGLSHFRLKSIRIHKVLKCKTLRFIGRRTNLGKERFLHTTRANKPIKLLE